MTFESLIRDFRHAVRSLRRSPGLVAVAVLSLGLALALNTTTFAVLDGVLNPYLPIKDAKQVFIVRQFGDRASHAEMYEFLRDNGRIFEGVALFGGARGLARRVQVSDSIETGYAVWVSQNLFELLGIRPELGRTFGPADAQAAIISYRLWTGALGKRPLDGLSVQVDGRVFSVVGVAPPGLDFPLGDAWLLTGWRQSSDPGAE